MLLKEEHIAVFQANWDDKATNIRAIAKELALGLDSFVFLDDNPVERGLIRREIPEVAVPELDNDPASYARTLAAAGYFRSDQLFRRRPRSCRNVPGQCTPAQFAGPDLRSAHPICDRWKCELSLVLSNARRARA